METYRILFQMTKRDTVKILRVYGSFSHVALPDYIEEHKVDEVASYCFSASRHLPSDDVQEVWMSCNEDGIWQQENHNLDIAVKELCGQAVEKIVLPNTVQMIGNCAFYNCKKLKSMQIGAALEEIGSDAFMNTLSFHQIILNGDVKEKTGLKQILAQISSDMEVVFCGKNGIDAILFYPEYLESYDEIAPAHLFGRSISGEGFRARQSFVNGVVEFTGYDAVFPQACVDENEKTLVHMALNRLYYPCALLEHNRWMYYQYLYQHREYLVKDQIRKRDLNLLEFLHTEKILCDDELADFAAYASDLEWVEGVAAMLKWKQKNNISTSYEFDMI